QRARLTSGDCNSHRKGRVKCHRADMNHSTTIMSLEKRMAGCQFLCDMLATVDALLPLSLLEAVRDVDTPADLDSEFVDELRNKRLGLSDTVYLQIRRYSEAVRKRQRPAHEESVALARLIGRRNDAESVFRAAGRYLARESY